MDSLHTTSGALSIHGSAPQAMKSDVFLIDIGFTVMIHGLQGRPLVFRSGLPDSQQRSAHRGCARESAGLSNVCVRRSSEESALWEMTVWLLLALGMQ